MQEKGFNSVKSYKYINILLWLIVAAGIAIRIAVYLQNRNLIIDEANITRNIYERDFTGLLVPLNYQQYAPPVFLWMIKLSSVLFGFSEYSLRSYALVSGIAAMFLVYAILKRVCTLNSMWYPLYLFASAAIFIRFSSEVKQYMPDAMIAATLLLLALRAGVHSRYFAVVWILAGSLAIWASMPSVFTLFSILCYYATIIYQNRNYKKFIPLLSVGAIWLAQFLAYYFVVLKPQAQSSYLQNYHQHDFITVTDWSQNGEILLQLIGRPGGFTVVAVGLNLLLLTTGVVSLIRKNIPLAILLVLPVITLLFASLLHQYSMASRLILFAMIPILILLGRGFSIVMQLNVAPVRIMAMLIAFICAWNNKILDQLDNNSEKENLTVSLDFVKQYNIPSGQQLYIHSGAVPDFIYYTQIHPAKNSWKIYKNAHLLDWGTNYDSLAEKLSHKSAFVLTSVVPGELERVKSILVKQPAEAEMDTYGGHVIILK
jgi:4-amino-4-deoxy-L-arabinose transferase-like glycosyltransferase